jgi:hypothetical protein
MFIRSLPRQVLAQWIARAIEQGDILGEVDLDGASYRLTVRERSALIAVPHASTHVTWGSWHVENGVTCGCPAVEAGLATEDGQTDSLAVTVFVDNFDQQVNLHLADVFGDDAFHTDDYAETYIPSTGVFVIH